MMNHGCENCTHCGACCAGLDIELSKEDIRSLVSLGYRTGDFLETEPVPRMKNVGRDRRCVFLDRKNFCAIHTRHGHEAKPHTCRHYPKITPEVMQKKDYHFFRYGGKTFTCDVLVKMLDSLKNAGGDELFEVLLFHLEKLRKHDGAYVDVFNYSGRKRHSELRKALARRRIKKLAAAKIRQDDAGEFGMIEERRKFNQKRFIETLQKKISGGEGYNQNLPEMLLAYLYAIKNAKPRDAKALAEYFFKWNEKRF